VCAILQRHADNPSAFLALNRDTSQFRLEGIDGLIAYRPSGRHHLIQFGGVFADASDQDKLLEAFLAMALRLRKRVIAVQLLKADAERYAAHGFTVNQFGASYACSLAGFELKGRPYVALRNKISRARRAGIEVGEVGVDIAVSGELDARLAEVDDEWLRGKGRHVKELRFMVGERGGPAGALRRLFVAREPDHDVVGYISFSPVFGRHPGWLHDLSRRRPGAAPGTMELAVITAVKRFQSEAVQYLHFGLTPFTGLGHEQEVATRSKVATGIVHLLATRGERIYPAASQLAYKQKWSPDLIQAEYVGFSNGVSLGGVWSLLRTSNIV
jgi:lysylphosphatidylglycerol synthetase-like protein (DUF2156 family)